MCDNEYNDTGIWMGELGWIIDRFEGLNALDIYIEQLKFYDNMGCLFDAELYHPPSWDIYKADFYKVAFLKPNWLHPSIKFSGII